jgi:hypothetical protein
MDIFNRPQAIAEDTIYYTLYLPPNLSDKISATSFAASIIAFVESYLPNFVWNRDAFEVKIVSNPGDNSVWILEGRMRVGDCVDDEWFTVWLLKQISSKWEVVIRWPFLCSHLNIPDPIGRSVCDSDGQFLLIEAAEVLPSWVKPINSENRVCPFQIIGSGTCNSYTRIPLGLDLQLPLAPHPPLLHISEL